MDIRIPRARRAPGDTADHCRRWHRANPDLTTARMAAAQRTAHAGGSSVPGELGSGLERIRLPQLAAANLRAGGDRRRGARHTALLPAALVRLAAPRPGPIDHRRRRPARPCTDANPRRLRARHVRARGSESRVRRSDRSGTRAAHRRVRLTDLPPGAFARRARRPLPRASRERRRKRSRQSSVSQNGFGRSERRRGIPQMPANPAKPSQGLEPWTPSLPWRQVRHKQASRVHGMPANTPDRLMHRVR
jgi:hypothetical protein